MPNWMLAAIGVIGLVVGLAIGWALASSRSRPRVSKELSETTVHNVRAVEQLKESVAAQLQDKERELEDLRTKLEQEHLTRAKTLAEVKHAVDQKSRLSSELQIVVDESFREVGQFYEISSTLERALHVYTQAVESMEARLLEVTRRLREFGISAGAPLSASTRMDRESPAPEHPQTEESADPTPEPAPTIPPAPLTPLKTDSPLPTKRVSPGGPGRPHAAR